MACFYHNDNGNEIYGGGDYGNDFCTENKNVFPVCISFV